MLFKLGKKQNEEQLLKGCVAGDEKSRNATYLEWASYMKGVCMRYVSDGQLAEDIMHDAWIKVFMSVERVKWQGEGSFRAWVARVMINCCIDHLKKAKRLNNLSIEYADAVAIEDEAEGDDTLSLLSVIKEQGICKEDLLSVLESLPEANRVVFNLYAIEKLKHREIADLLGIAEEASRTRLKRARAQLKEQLAARFAKAHCKA